MKSIRFENSFFVQFLLFIGAFAFYLHFLFPSIYGGDTGELVVSSHILGIPHAPGYPLLNIMGKTSELIVPFGNTAFRINLLAAVLGAVTLVLFFKLMCSLTQEIFPSLLSAVYLGWVPIFFEQSILTEVFMLNAFFVVAILLIIVKLKGGNSVRYVYLASLLFGLGLGNHHTIILIIPAIHCIIQPRKKVLLFSLYLISFILIFFKLSIGILFFTVGLIIFYIINPPQKIAWNIMGKSLLWIIAGLFVYLYLPIRARVDPAINFGDPENLKAFLNVITRRAFGSLTLHPTALYQRTLQTFWAQALGFADTMVKHIGIPGIIVSFFGMREAVKRKKTASLLLLFIIPGPVFIYYSNLSPNALALWRLERFFLVPDIAMAIFIGLGFVWLLQRIRAFVRVSGLYEKAAGVLILFICVYPLDHINNSRFHFYLRDFGNNIVKSCAPESSLIFDTKLFDEYGSSVAYITLVEKKRTDLTLISRSGTMLKNIYGNNFYYLRGEKRLELIRTQEELWINKSTHPVYYAVMDRNVLPDGSYRYYGLLNIRGDTYINPYPLYVQRALYKENMHLLDYPTRLLLVHYPYFKGKMYMEKNDVEQAQILFESCMNYGWDMEWLMYNIGAVYSAYGDLDKAEQYYTTALYLDPFFPDTYFGLGFVYYRRKRYEQAEYAFKQVIKLNPDFVDAYYNLGVAQWYGGKRDSARESWNTYIAYKPNSSQAQSIQSYLK